MRVQPVCFAVKVESECEGIGPLQPLLRTQSRKERTIIKSPNRVPLARSIPAPRRSVSRMSYNNMLFSLLFSTLSSVQSLKMVQTSEGKEER